mmetsp:Transcript_7650/g.12149  ORF Transcript_7650/g.12149 Transcript_7650/m.12149 type:complete len:104 (+) Transcript_7650:365-676(+)
MRCPEPMPKHQQGTLAFVIQGTAGRIVKKETVVPLQRAASDQDWSHGNSNSQLNAHWQPNGLCQRRSPHQRSAPTKSASVPKELCCKELVDPDVLPQALKQLG